MAKLPSKQLVVCIDNDGYPASLERRKIYVALRDPAAEKHGLLRVVDESGEDYLYPKMFLPHRRVAAGRQESCVGGCLMTGRVRLLRSQALGMGRWQSLHREERA